MDAMNRIRRRRLHSTHSAVAEDFIEPEVPRRERLRRVKRALVLDVALVAAACASLLIIIAVS